MRSFKTLAIDKADDLIFGSCKHPLSCGFGLEIGNGAVYPEINFTLPAMPINEQSWPGIKQQYKELTDLLGERARKLRLPGLVLEFEQLPPMTMRPVWGAEITAILKESLHQLYTKQNIPCALRVTVTDLRDGDRPPLLRSGKNRDNTIKAFELCAAAGADILSIESVGGKEVHDQALVYGDLNGIIGSLGLLAARDMAYLWDEICAIAQKHNIIAGGDTACGFANTAMQLAGKGMIPSVLAAVDRAASIPRSLVAYERGAVGPSKDCAYEGPALKAITGFPISMEGRSASCAHFSPLGNIAGAAADLWSNESVQNIKLLSGPAPEAFLELLAYDCRLYNSALSAGAAKSYRDLLVQSDVQLDPQALMLEPQTVLELARTIVNEPSPLKSTGAVVKHAISVLRKAYDEKRLPADDNEQGWLDRLEAQLAFAPASEEAMLEYLEETFGTLFKREAYGL